MGNNWSWPCTDREKIKYKPFISYSQFTQNPGRTKHDDMCSILVITISTLSLDKELRQTKYDLLPISICDHPLNREESIIIYQKLSSFMNTNERSRYSYISNFSFTGNSASSWKSLLENDIQNCLESNQKFLGITGYSGNYYLAFYKRPKNNIVKSKISIIVFEDEINRITLESFFNSSFMDFKSFFTYKNVNLFIMEAEETDEKFNENPYCILELAESEIDSLNFENIVAENIEDYIKARNELRGFIIYKSKLFIVFKQKSLENQ